MVEPFEWDVDQILNTLEDCGIAERMLVIFFSDNGVIRMFPLDQFGLTRKFDNIWMEQK